MGKGKKRAKGPPPNEPHTPATSSNPDVRSPVTIALKRKRSVSEDRQSSIAPFHTPPTSPATPALEEPRSMSVMMQEDPARVRSEPPPAYTSAVSVPFLNANDIASSNQDIVAIADLFSTMKKTLVSMKGSLDRLGGQSEKMVSCALDIQAAEQLNQLRWALDQQISKQTQDVETVRLTLEHKIRAEVEARIRTHLRELVKVSLRDKVREKVREELENQVPENLRQQVIAHQRQILEVKTTLHNSEARHYNSLQTSARSNAPLRPLLRPLPTPEQSPVVLPLSRSTSLGSNVLRSPTSAIPSVPAPTPIKRSTSNPFREPPTASTHFPADLRSLFAMGPDQTRQLLRDYGLVSEAPTPAIEKPPRDRGLPIVDEEPDVTSDGEKPSGIEEESHADDMNKFMAHIGVPFLMVPAPKVKEDPITPMSSRTRRRMFLSPLIIK